MVGIASQPFRLFWTSDEGKPRPHAPDFFTRCGDGSALVLDVRQADRIRPRDRATFEPTRIAGDLLGWSYDVVGAAAEPLLANVRWLAWKTRMTPQSHRSNCSSTSNRRIARCLVTTHGSQ